MSSIAKSMLCIYILELIHVTKSISGFVLLVKQVQSSPVTPLNSSSSSASDPSASWPQSEELDSGINRAYYAGEKEIFGELIENMLINLSLK